MSIVANFCIVKNCERVVRAKGFCVGHYERQGLNSSANLDNPVREWDKSGNPKWVVSVNGYAVRNMKVDGKTKLVSQHRFVMEQHLGRRLIAGENVHHKNGVRLDNRIENLELWSTIQPSGQRVEDKLAWAYEIIALYGK